MSNVFDPTLIDLPIDLTTNNEVGLYYDLFRGSTV